MADAPSSKRARLERKGDIAAVASVAHNVLAKFVVVAGDDARIPRLLQELPAKYLVSVMQYLLPRELVGLRGVKRAVAYLPDEWFVEHVQVTVPRRPESVIELVPRSVSTTSMPTQVAVSAGASLDVDTDPVDDWLAGREMKLGTDIGTGAVGVVFEVCSRNPRLPRICSDYVVKRMSLHDALLSNDLRIHTHLVTRAPNTCPILYDALVSGDHVYILMERLGRALGDVWRERRQLVERKIMPMPRPTWWWAEDLLTEDERRELIALVHRASFTGGIWHRDLHQENVMQRASGRGWKLIDFGQSLRWSEIADATQLVRDLFKDATLELPTNVLAAANTCFRDRRWIAVWDLFFGIGVHVRNLIHRDPAPDVEIPGEFLAAMARIWRWHFGESAFD